MKSMFKKIGLYSLLFVMVTLSTAAVIVFLNRQPSPETSKTSAVSERDMALTNIMNATMSIENYDGKFALASTDGTIDISGRFSVLSLAQNPSAKVVVSGVVLGQNVEIVVKYKSDWIYATYNGFSFKVASNDIAELGEILLDLIGDNSNSSLDVDAILAELSNLKLTNLDNGYNIQISLPNIGDVEIVTNKDYLPLSVSAPSLTLMGKQFSLSLSGVVGSASQVTITADERGNCINVSESKQLITSTINSLKYFPIALNGELSLLGSKIQVDALVDSQTNFRGTLTLKNIVVEFVSYNKKVYVNVCGTKLVGTMQQLVDIVSKYVTSDLESLLKTLKLSNTNISLGGMNLVFDTTGDFLNSVTIDHKLVSGTLNIKNTPVDDLKQPTGYEKALTISQMESIILPYTELADATEFSFIFSGDWNNIDFNLNGYLNLINNNIDRFYVGNTVMNKTFHMWNTDGMSYFNFGNEKVKFSNTFAKSMFDYLTAKFGRNLPQNVSIVDLIASQIVSVETEKNGNIHVSLECGLALDIQNVSEGYNIVVKGPIENKQLSATVLVFKESAKNKRIATQYLYKHTYTDLSEYDDVAKAAVDTFTMPKTTFEGKMRVKGPFGVTNWLNLDIRIETSYQNGKLSFVAVITNLPTTCFITDTTAFKYKSQKAIISYSNGTVSVVRYGIKGSRNKEELRLSKSYKLTDISVGIINDIVGFGGMLGNTILSELNSSANQVSNASFTSLASLKKIDNGLAIGLSTSKLSKQLSDTNISIAVDNGKIAGLFVNLTAALKVEVNLTRN